MYSCMDVSQVVGYAFTQWFCIFLWDKTIVFKILLYINNIENKKKKREYKCIMNTEGFVFLDIKSYYST